MVEIVMTTRTNAKLTLAAAALFMLPGARCGEILDDPSFELWCEEALCSWEVEEGEAVQAPTWHSSDHGVELVGNPATISQLVDRDSGNLQCLHFHLLADIEETASVTLELDFYDDGVVEFTQIIPTSDWAMLSYHISLPTTYQGIRFRLSKSGGGRAILAEISASDSDECTDEPMEIGKRPSGATCDDPEQCVSGECAPAMNLSQSICNECSDSTGCGADICGVDSTIPVFLDPYLECGEVGRHSLGEICVTDAECSTGICCGGACSTCCGGNTCGAAACERRDPGGDFVYCSTRPYQCDPEGGSAESGVDCLTDSDCASGLCQGSDQLLVCLKDGRNCAVDRDCPPDPVDPFAEVGHCVAAGTRSGSCQ